MSTATSAQVFDEWPDRYERWFTTPIGKIVRKVEGDLAMDLVKPVPGERLLDVGCGTGVFTTDFISAGVEAVGLDISAPMLKYALSKTGGRHFSPVQADMRSLPFTDNSFDKTISITALEFIRDARSAVDEMFRVTMPGGFIVLATLNSLSPWAERRDAKTARGERHILENASYRSGDDLLRLSQCPGVSRTAVHFQKDADPGVALEIEEQGRRRKSKTGAFVAAMWQKPEGAH